MRRIGAVSERFGSISFNLKRFQDKAGLSFCHYVTLYDSLDDDLFEGTEGVDDEFDYPRLLVDYKIVSSKYTSLANRIDALDEDVERARNKQDRL